MTAVEWQVPTRGDSRHVGDARRHRGGWGEVPTSTVATDPRAGRSDPFHAIDQVVKAIDTAGYDTIVVPYDPHGEESWIVAGHALRHSRYADVAVEFHPGFGTPVYAAKVSSTWQRSFGGRLSWQLRIETDVDDDRARGQELTDVEKYRRAEEFLTVAKGVWTGAGARGGGFAGGDFNFAGDYFEVIDGGLDRVVADSPFPQIRLAGSAEAALALSARHADVHLFELASTGLPVGTQALAAAAADAGRAVQAGLYLPVIARSSAAEAQERLRRQWKEVHGAEAEPDDLGSDGLTFSAFDQIGHRHARGLVGSYHAVAERISELSSAGIDRFILSGIPNLEEIYRNAEHVLYRADRHNRLLA